MGILFIKHEKIMISIIYLMQFMIFIILAIIKQSQKINKNYLFFYQNKNNKICMKLNKILGEDILN